MKIFTCAQIKEIDEITIRTEPISSFNLMERAAGQLLLWYLKTFDRARRVLVFVGPGNNGGDGLALARMLALNRYNVGVYYLVISERTSPEWKLNHQKLRQETNVPFISISRRDQIPDFRPDDVLVDAVFGSGLTRPAGGLASDIIRLINQTGCTVVSIDIPSGLFGEDNGQNDPESIIMADYTLTFQFPRLSFMFAENAKYTGEWIVLPIGLSNSAINNTETPYSFVQADALSTSLKIRKRFDHKGIYGHGMLIAGSGGKMGAAVLGARAALRTGIGLLTCHVPGAGNQIIQTCVPEAMSQPDSNNEIISEIPGITLFDAIGIGPGIGTDPVTQKAFQSVLLNRSVPIVIDADGLNILGLNDKWLSVLPEKTVLTPHLKEFERMAGKSDNGYMRLKNQISFSAKYNCIVVLKSAFTSVSSPDGRVSFNSTGNPGMATAGSGDVLTGMILALLAQGYSPENAAVIGVYLHGLAGDIAAEKDSPDSIIASDIIENIGNAFKQLKGSF
ncbi:MAG TPA: NAD(P)H-hydrate dehydratase [Bacteroidales bacterium]|nr:NAD(P)H-hydrate dehydratase [Bacteroidales bacterium]HNR42732.1 NAD(P)H-hydrate dehydratase [Bacteroidales bacterium]HPM18482.1 NAD(P)H-hydrate dehydratase [Bacteroidales bacterium]